MQQGNMYILYKMLRCQWYILASTRETIGWFLQKDRGISKQDRRYCYWQLKERHANDSKLWNCARFSNWQVNMSSGRKKLSSLQNLETTGKYRKWLGKHDVEHYQVTRVIRKHSGNMAGGITRYGKRENVCYRKLWILVKFLKVTGKYGKPRQRCTYAFQFQNKKLRILLWIQTKTGVFH